LRTDIYNGKHGLWPSPKSQNGKAAAIHGEGGLDLQTAVFVHWSTPTDNDGKNSLTESQAGRGTLTANLVESGIKGQLSPDWTEHLMGYPDGWTDIDRENVDMGNRYPAAWIDGSWDTIPRAATGVKNRVKRLKCLGNAIVPQIAELLWRLIARVL
jgi:site-specific DNA-cytosine methylase